MIRCVDNTQQATLLLARYEFVLLDRKHVCHGHPLLFFGEGNVPFPALNESSRNVKQGSQLSLS